MASTCAVARPGFLFLSHSGFLFSLLPPSAKNGEAEKLWYHSVDLGAGMSSPDPAGRTSLNHTQTQELDKDWRRVNIQFTLT